MEDNSAFAVTHLALLGVKRQEGTFWRKKAALAAFLLPSYMFEVKCAEDSGLRIKKVVKNIYEFFKDMGIHQSATYASSVAFFFFLSIFPALMFLCSLIPYLPITENDLIRIIKDIVPENIEQFFVAMIGDIYHYASTLLPVTAIITLWTAGTGIMGLIRALNGIFEIKDKRNYFLTRIIAAVYTLLLLLVIIISMLLAFVGKIILGKVGDYIPLIDSISEWILYFRGFFILGILTVVLDFAYSFLPAERQKLLYQLPGAIFASLAWSVMTWGFSIYMDMFGGYTIYGNLSTIMVMMVWLYLCFTIVIMGAFMNKYYQPLYSIGLKKAKEYRKERKISKPNSNDE